MTWVPPRPKDEDVVLTDDAFNQERVRAVRTWLGSLVWVEALVVLILLALLPVLGGPVRDSENQFMEGARAFLDITRAAGGGSGSVDPFGVLSVLAAIGIASSVAMASAQARLIRAAERLRRAHPPRHRDVFDAQFAAMAATGVTGAIVLALVFSHAVMIGSFVDAAHGSDPLPSLVTGALAMLLLLLLLAESARLITPGRSPLPVQRRGTAKALNERLVYLTVHAARRPRRTIFSVLMVTALALVLGALVWWARLTGLLGFLVLLLGGTVLLTGLRRTAAPAVLEQGVSRWVTVAASLGMGSVGWLAALSSTGSMILAEAPPVGWVPTLVAGGIGMLALGVGMVLAVLGSAGIGPLKRDGVRKVAEAAQVAPNSQRRAWTGVVVPSALLAAVELVICGVLTVLVAAPVNQQDWAMSAASALLLVIGGAVSLFDLAVGLDRARQLARWPQQLRPVLADGGVAIVMRPVAVLMVMAAPLLTISVAVLVQADREDLVRAFAAGGLCLWLLLHLAVIVIGSRWPTGSLGSALHRWGERITAVRARSARQWLGRALSDHEPWSDLRVQIWLRHVGEGAKDRLEAS